MPMARITRTRKNRRRERNRRGGCCQSTISGMSLACFHERFGRTAKQTQLYAVFSQDHRLTPSLTRVQNPQIQACLFGATDGEVGALAEVEVLKTEPNCVS